MDTSVDHITRPTHHPQQAPRAHTPRLDRHGRDLAQLVMQVERADRAAKRLRGIPRGIPMIVHPVRGVR